MVQKPSQVELLISLLVRFPQICRVHYEPQSSSLRLVFLTWGANLRGFPDFVKTFKTHVAAFHNLKQEQSRRVSLKKTEHNTFALVEVLRDVESLSLEELNLMIQLIRDHYGEALIEEGPEVEEDDEFEYNALIESVLSSVFLGEEQLTGFRENGRVLVFSTPLAGVGKS